MTLAPSHLDSIAQALMQYAPGGLCDRCISTLTGIHPVQAVNQCCRKEDGRSLRRSAEKQACGDCGEVRTVTRILNQGLLRREKARVSPTTGPKKTQEPFLRQPVVASNRIVLECEERCLAFQEVELEFRDHGRTNVFAAKNDKTVRQTLEKERYHKLQNVVIRRYCEDLDQPLGVFLMSLKQRGDPVYRQFLNPYGDEVYCDFHIEKSALTASKGLYCYCIGANVMYIGRSHDPFERRVNSGYGRIAPKNCYLDGQAANCHVNSLIEQESLPVQYFVCPLEVDKNEINALEKALICSYRPPWNVKMG